MVLLVFIIWKNKCILGDRSINFLNLLFKNSLILGKKMKVTRIHGNESLGNKSF